MADWDRPGLVPEVHLLSLGICTDFMYPKGLWVWVYEPSPFDISASFACRPVIHIGQEVAAVMGIMPGTGRRLAETIPGRMLPVTDLLGTWTTFICPCSYYQLATACTFPTAPPAPALSPVLIPVLSSIIIMVMLSCRSCCTGSSSHNGHHA
jgi:hypothetical protein